MIAAPARLVKRPGPAGVRVHGTSDKSGVTVPWAEGFDPDVFISLEAGTLNKFRELVNIAVLKHNEDSGVTWAAKISTVSVAGAQLAMDNRIFFSRDPVAMDAVGLEILEEKRREQGLESVRGISTHIAACARKGLGTADLRKIDVREIVI